MIFDIQRDKLSKWNNDWAKANLFANSNHSVTSPPTWLNMTGPEIHKGISKPFTLYGQLVAHTENTLTNQKKASAKYEILQKN